MIGHSAAHCHTWWSRRRAFTKARRITWFGVTAASSSCRLRNFYPIHYKLAGLLHGPGDRSRGSTKSLVLHLHQLDLLQQPNNWSLALLPIRLSALQQPLVRLRIRHAGNAGNTASPTTKFTSIYEKYTGLIGVGNVANAFHQGRACLTTCLKLMPYRRSRASPRVEERRSRALRPRFRQLRLLFFSALPVNWKTLGLDVETGS